MTNTVVFLYINEIRSQILFPWRPPDSKNITIPQQNEHRSVLHVAVTSCHYCWCAGQISERLYSFIYKSRGFDTLRDLTIRCHIEYWNGALIVCCYDQPENVDNDPFSQFSWNNKTWGHFTGTYALDSLVNDIAPSSVAQLRPTWIFCRRFWMTPGLGWFYVHVRPSWKVQVEKSACCHPVQYVLWGRGLLPPSV